MDSTPGMPRQPDGLECDRLLDAGELREHFGRHGSAGSLGHRASVQAIAHELQRPLDEVALLYCKELNYLRREAKVLDFLPVLIAKRVRALYKVSGASVL